MLKRFAPHIAVVSLAVCAVVGMLAFTNKPSDNYSSGYYGIDSKAIQFLDDVQSQPPPQENLTDLFFVDISGHQVQLKEYIGKKNVVLVLTRGFSYSICLYCSTQTSRLIANYPEFKQRDAEVVVVFPIRTDADKGRLDEFISATKKNMDRPPERVPFPIWLDMELKGVDALGLRDDLSKPATFILDKEGQVRFSYVGSSLSDRPSVKAMLKQLDALEKTTEHKAGGD